MRKSLGIEHKRKRQREWAAARRQSWLDEHGPCIKCGSCSDLEIDHIDPTQKVNHRVFSWRKERRDAELAKCQVLCRLCHKEKTKEDLKTCRVYPTIRHIHGTTTEYRRGCRCAPCVAAKAVYSEAYNRIKYARQQLLAA